MTVRDPADGLEDEPETPHSKIAREKPDWSLMGFSELLVHVALFMLSGPTLILLQKYVLGVLDFDGRERRRGQRERQSIQGAQGEPRAGDSLCGEPGAGAGGTFETAVAPA